MIEDDRGHVMHHQPETRNKPAMYICQFGKGQDRESCRFGGVSEVPAEKFVVGEFLTRVTPESVQEALEALEAGKATTAGTGTGR